MSLYNALFGVNPVAGILLQALGTSTDGIPRFRDCYLSSEYGDENPRIAIHTRTGGGNRDYYESEQCCRDHYPERFTGEKQPSGPWNSDLRNLPGFLYDENDDFDSTYATFYFSIPDAFRPIIDTLRGMGVDETPPAERWKRVLADMQSGQRTEETDRALKVGEGILKAIELAEASQ